MPNLNRITRLSGWLYWASYALAYLMPLTLILIILGGWFDPENLRLRFPVLPADTIITAFQGTLVAGIGVLAVLPLIAVFLAMRSLFGRYRRGEILTDACADDILRIGRALIAVAVMAILVPTLQMLVLSWNVPSGRMLSVGIDSGSLGFLLSGGMLFVIGWVMREAARAATENAGFI
jgi:Protein of unknown function (DUF2975)